MVKCEVFSSPISILFSSLLLMLFPLVRSGDDESLLVLRASFDPLNVLQWGLVANVCQWQGVKECSDGRIIKLVVEGFNLSGTLDGPSLNQLDQLRILSFKENSLSGQIPKMFGLVNLKSLYLNNNRFSGEIPISLSTLNLLKIVVLSGNRISGQIPHSLVDLRRLYVIYLQDNQLNGSIPPFSQNSLRFFNVSNNALSGEIPQSLRFNESSFSGNMDLCGEQIQRPCSFGPFTSPSYPISLSRNVKHHKKLILIVVLSVGGFCLLCIAGVLLLMCCLRKTSRETETRSKTFARTGEEGPPSTGGGEGGFSWDQDGEGLGSLTFLGPEDQHMSYSLEDLLKALAKTLGRGTIGSTYKAVMESGYIVTVKRLKDSSYPRIEEFRRHVEILGQLRHPNLVPLRAYFQAKEERLFVYDYFPNGSLFSLVHGSRACGSKPLHWTSCLKIADDIATGLLYIHQNPGLTHGNLKSTNVLLGPDFESCLTDYGLSPFENPDAMNESSSSNSLFYRAPECRDVQKPLTQPADVYSYGVLILELLTGKNPFQDLVQEHGSDIVQWVQTIQAEENESGSSNETSEEKLGVLVNVAMACISIEPESRPIMMNVLRMIRDVRVEVQVQMSSNSSGHSPGRWSGSVHGLPREEQLSM